MPLFYSVDWAERLTKGRTNPDFPAWQPALLVYAGGPFLPNNITGRVRGAACACSMRRAPSTGIIGGGGCLFSVCFRFFSTSENKMKKSTCTMHE